MPSITACHGGPPTIAFNENVGRSGGGWTGRLLSPVASSSGSNRTIGGLFDSRNGSLLVVRSSESASAESVTTVSAGKRNAGRCASGAASSAVDRDSTEAATINAPLATQSRRSTFLAFTSMLRHDLGQTSDRHVESQRFRL